VEDSPQLRDYALYATVQSALFQECSAVLKAKPPKVLYHYTSAAGLLGIINDSVIFLTDSMFMNDQSELAYGRDLASEVLTEVAQHVSNRYARSALRLARDYLNSGVSVLRAYRAYAACFCADGNLLSQWRAYGRPGAGYAIGLVAKQLPAAQTGNTERLRLIKVEYRRAQQVKVIERAIQLYLSYLPKFDHEMGDGEDRAELLAPLPILLGTLFPHFKHPVFREEKEWRVVLQVGDAPPDALLRFRETTNNIAPYLSARFAAGALPLRSVTHAPSLEPHIKKIALRELLAARGYSDVAVLGSDIPLRLS